MSQHLLLEAIQFPRRQGFDCSDDRAFRELIDWLEIEKIRACSVAERKALGDLKGSAWGKAFQSYLELLACPLKLEDSKREGILGWLLRHAVHLEYSDKVGIENIREVLSQICQDTAAMSSAEVLVAARKLLEEVLIPVCQQLQRPKDKIVLQTKSNKAARKLLEEVLIPVCQQLQRPEDKIVLQTKSSKAARKLLEEVLIPVCQQLQHPEDNGGPSSDDANPSSSGQKALSNIFQQLPLGFDVDDPQVEKAAKLLRLLYLADFRSLQSSVDQSIVNIQTNADAEAA
eukprot:gene26450-17549_t